MCTYIYTGRYTYVMLRVLSVLHVTSKLSEQRGQQNCTFDPSALHKKFEITGLQALAI